MKINNKKNSIPTINAHWSSEKFWTYLVSLFLLVLAGGLFYSSWLFRATADRLDDPALPTFESNTAQLRSIEGDVVAAERAIAERTGTIETESE